MTATFQSTFTIPGKIGRKTLIFRCDDTSETCVYGWGSGLHSSDEGNSGNTGIPLSIGQTVVLQDTQDHTYAQALRFASAAGNTTITWQEVF